MAGPSPDTNTAESAHAGPSASGGTQTPPPQPTAQVSASTSAAEPTSAASLPPEAIALAGRLFDAARHGQTEIFEQALPRGLSANMTNDKGDSLIMLASYHGHAPLVRLLLAHGADPNRLNDRGQSPLAGVVFKHEAEVVRVLLAGGADPDLGAPSAREATVVFRQEEYAALFEEQTRRLREAGVGARNGAGG